MKRISIILLCMFVLLCLLMQGCEMYLPDSGTTTEREGAATTDPSTTATEEDPYKDAPRISLTDANGTALYKVVIPEEASDSLKRNAATLVTKLNNATSSTFVQTDDYTRDGNPADSTGEIIIGDCKRTDAKTVLAELKYKDYAVRVTETNIVISAYEDTNLKKGIDAFAKLFADRLETDGKVVNLIWKEDIYHAGSYDTRNMTVNGTSLSDFTLVYADSNEFGNEAATTLRNAIAVRFGYLLPIISDATAETAHEILLGKTNRAFSQSVYSGANMPGPMEYFLLAQGGKLQIASGGELSLVYAVDHLGSRLPYVDTQVEKSADGTVTNLISNVPALAEGNHRFMTYNVLVEFEGWGSGGKIPSAVEIRKEGIASIILNYRPDVAALEEMFEKWNDQLPELIGDEYGFVGVNRTGDNYAYRNRTILIYNKSRVKCVDSGYVDIEAAKPQTINRRVVTWGVFEDLTTKERFAVFGTHWSVDNEENRMVEAGRMADVIKDITVTKGYNVPVIAMGDFNTAGEAMTEFVNQSGLTRKVSNGVDHILIDGDRLKAEYTEVISGIATQRASDHKPLICDVSIK